MLKKATPAASQATPSARDKIADLAELAIRVQQAKARGLKVVYAHGVFDLLHVGHVRHLEAARREGSFLVVTVTADKFVNKGPGRPVFTEALRAEMLAALAFVDAVAVNNDFTAENALHVIQPDVYVKGVEYRDAEQDVTGKITAERAAVESYGGAIVFTDEETYSSSSLLNRHFNLYEPVLQRHLEAMRTDAALPRLLRAIDGLRGLKVLVVGEAIIDEYQYVTALGRPSKESILATQFVEREVFAGGAMAAANHIAGFCDRVELLTCLGAQDSYEELIRSSLRENVVLNYVMREDGPTTRKCRFVDMGYSLKKLFEIYFMNDAPLAGAQQQALDRLITERIKAYDLVIVTDFGHGFLNGSTVDLLTREAPFLAVNTQTNSGNHGYNPIGKYSRADYICLDKPEARLAVRDKYADADHLARLLPAVIDCGRIVITTGKNGCVVYDRASANSTADALDHIPALTNTIVDTVGAGDAFFAITAPLVFNGIGMSDVGFLGNAAGAIKVGVVGHRSSIDRAAYIKFLTALLK